jgi:hypothetical protein
LKILHTDYCSFRPSSCAKAKGFTVKAEFEESEGLGYPNNKVFDFVKNGGTFKLTTFPDYAQYMVRLRVTSSSSSNSNSSIVIVV